MRELKHTIEKAIVLADNRIVVTEKEIKLNHSPGELEESFAGYMTARKRAYLESLMSVHGGNVSRAAVGGGLDLRRLQRLIRRYEIDLDRYRDLRE